MRQYDLNMQTDNETGTVILVMQRGDADQKLILSTLKKVGFRVVNSETGSEIPVLLDAPRNAQAQPLRLVVADPTTPGLDFPQLLKKAQEKSPSVPVLCLCGDEPDEEDSAAVVHLKRPFRRAHLLASILDATEKPMARTA